jgi:uncharacterized repeat protein (TIGR03943 family)
MSVIGLLPLFNEKGGPSNSQSEPEPKKLKSDFVVIFLIPIIVAIIGLTTPVILTTYVFVFLIGLTRLNLFQKTDNEKHQNQSEIPGTALILLVIPLILGVIVPVRPLSTSSLSTRGMGLSAPVSIEQQSITTMKVIPDDRTVLDWIKIFNYEEDLTPYLNQSANVIGFVYHDPRLQTGQFMVGRFAITCCVADAFAIGMAVDWPDSSALSDNSWVNVKGTVDVVIIDGQELPLIRAISVNPVQAPEQPYLYP